MSNKQKKKLAKAEQAEKRRLEAENAEAKSAEADEIAETPDGNDEEATTPGNAIAASGSSTKLVGLTGELAIQKAGRKTRKKLLEEANKEEEER